MSLKISCCPLLRPRSFGWTGATLLMGIKIFYVVFHFPRSSQFGASDGQLSREMLYLYPPLDPLTCHLFVPLVSYRAKFTSLGILGGVILLLWTDWSEWLNVPEKLSQCISKNCIQMGSVVLFYPRQHTYKVYRWVVFEKIFIAQKTSKFIYLVVYTSTHVDKFCLSGWRNVNVMA